MTLKLDDLVKSSDLYKEAFIHKSLSSDKNFERLEFLGDALLGAKITEFLFAAYIFHCCTGTEKEMRLRRLWKLHKKKFSFSLAIRQDNPWYLFK